MPDKGRPRSFDPDQALRNAMNLFWARGYEGATLKELTEVMGINRPSLYAAFGSKEALFRRAIALYDQGEGKRIDEALNVELPVREAVARFLEVNVDSYSDPDKPNGCMIVLAAMVGTPENATLRDHLAALRRNTETALTRRLHAGVTRGELPPDTDCHALAGYLTTVLHGLSIQARDGASKEKLSATAQAALAGWDGLVAWARHSARAHEASNTGCLQEGATN